MSDSLVSNLYLVTSINQVTGDAMQKHIVAPNLKVIEDEIADITNVEVLGEVEILQEQA